MAHPLKVIFKGSYYKKDTAGKLRQTKFSDFSICFDEWWDSDIEIVFDSFAFIVPKGKTALDISKVKSENITISVINRAYLEGGTGASAGANGNSAIYGPEKNVTIEGEVNTNFEIKDGNGATATAAGGKGGDGGVAILIDSLTINMDGAITVYGGNGGNGGNGGLNGDGVTREANGSAGQQGA